MTERLTSAGRDWIVLADLAMGLAFTALIQLEIWVFQAGDLPLLHSIIASAVGTVTAMTVAVRSIAIVPAFVINAIGLYTLVALQYESDFYQWTNLLLLFTLAEARRPAPVALLGLGASLLGVASYFVAIPTDNPVVMGILIGLLWALVWSAGLVAAGRRRERSLQDDRDLAAALAATNQERLALQSQRAEMARELHDLIGHTVNVMVVHAGAARRAVRTDPDGAEEAIATIESTGRDALGELDRVLGVLRSDVDRPAGSGPGAAPGSGAAPEPGPGRGAGAGAVPGSDAGFGVGVAGAAVGTGADPATAPAPDLSALPALVRQFEAAGLPTTVRIDGPTGAVPAGLALSIYRIVQESLTNTLKHASAGRATVDVRIAPADDDRADGRSEDQRDGRREGRVEVTVVDDGRGDDRTDPSPAVGHGPAGRSPRGRGLTGIVERTRMHGGRADHGRRDDGALGFEVRCVLPLPSTSRPPRSASGPAPAPTSGSGIAGGDRG